MTDLTKARERTDCPLASAFKAANESSLSSRDESYSRPMMGGGKGGGRTSA